MITTDENSWENIPIGFTPVTEGKLARATKPRSKNKKLPKVGAFQSSDIALELLWIFCYQRRDIVAAYLEIFLPEKRSAV
ncbi:hypothetical protein CDL15_Pgr010872 [Punica granatum]|uniref:Uncharacterized protein n=1 Tax=Punica granatum TaxID=22663 RepID=A0A218W4X8_PUNGR|nr:hypothetical protein CDL15_Pgr010872 [Punica granatum]